MHSFCAVQHTNHQGNYDTAMVYYEGVVATIKRLLLESDGAAKESWNQVGRKERRRRRRGRRSRRKGEKKEKGREEGERKRRRRRKDEKRQEGNGNKC